MACLVQLSSLNGYVFAKKEDRLAYLSNYLTHFMTLLQKLQEMGNLTPNEALAISNIVRKIMLFFPASILTNLHPQLLEEYLQKITQLVRISNSRIFRQIAMFTKKSQFVYFLQKHRKSQSFCCKKVVRKVFHEVWTYTIHM